MWWCNSLSAVWSLLYTDYTVCFSHPCGNNIFNAYACSRFLWCNCCLRAEKKQRQISVHEGVSTHVKAVETSGCLKAPKCSLEENSNYEFIMAKSTAACLRRDPDCAGGIPKWETGVYVCFHCFCVLAYVHVQSYTLFVWLIHQPLSDTGDKLKGISSPGYILITVSWNTWENYISLLQWSMDDKGNDGVLCAKDRKGWIQEALSMRADDRRDVGGFCGVTLQGPISVL